MDKIESLRNQINLIDTQIMQLLDERYHLTKKVGEVKQELKIEVLDSNREQVIFDKTTKYSHSPEIKEVYKTIMNVSKSQQRK